MVDRLVEQPLGGPHRARPEPDAAVVEDLHRDVEALAGLAEHVLGRHPHVLEVEAPQVVAPQPHGVVALADLEALHPRLDDQRDVAVLAVHLAAGEGREDRALAAVADVALLAVQHPGAVGLLDRAALDVVGVRAGVRLGEREPGQLAAGGEVGEEALLLLLGAEHVDALEADRLVDAEDDRQRGVDPGEGLEHARIAGLREALAAVALRRRRGRTGHARRARGSRRRRSSAPPRSCAGRAGSRARRPPRSAPAPAPARRRRAAATETPGPRGSRRGTATSRTRSTAAPSALARPSPRSRPPSTRGYPAAGRAAPRPESARCPAPRKAPRRRPTPAVYRRRRLAALAVARRRDRRRSSSRTGGGGGGAAGRAARDRCGPSARPQPVRFTIEASGDLLIHAPVWERALALGGATLRLRATVR